MYKLLMLVAAFSVVWLFITINPCNCASNATKLYLLGLFPMIGPYAGGQSMLPASQLAVQDINTNPDILPGFELVMIPRDTSCDGGRAVDTMYKELYDKNTTKIMIIGGGCSVATEPVAQASHLWNLIQISFRATSPNLSNRAMYPLFFRLISTLSRHIVVKLAMFREFKWKKVATLHESAALFTLSMADFHKDAAQAGIEILGAESFVDNPTTQVANIKNLGARIIVGSFYSNMARRVFCAAFHQKMYGAKYVWILPGWYEPTWWRIPDDTIDCTLAQMDEATANYFAVDINALPSDSNRRPSLSGLTTNDFLRKFKAITGLDNPETLSGYADASLGYDTVWTAALALQEAQKQLLELDPPRTLADFKYDNVTTDILFDIISNLTFEGVSGPVKFTPTGDRVGLYVLRQLQGDNRYPVGQLDSTIGADEIVWDGYLPIQWQGGAPPIDFIIKREYRQTIQPSLFITGVAFASFGIVMACCFLAFNIHFRKIRVIKMSSPNINNMMLIGGILAYLSIIFLGVDTAMVSTETFLWMCKARTWCLSIGFSMAFGSIFSKTWRVHKIFTNKKAIKMVLKDHRLFSFVAILIFVDILLVILWETMDPLQTKEQYGLKEIDDENEDIVYTPIRMMCESSNQIYWIGAFYAIDGLLLVFGAFLAWETRHVSIPALNDSKYIGVCVYNVLILSFIGVPVSFILEERNVHFALVASLVWMATTFTLCVVFVPKIRMRNDIRPAQSSMQTPGTATQHRQIMDLVEKQKKELQELRQEIGLHELKMKKCKCSANEEQDLVHTKTPIGLGGLVTDHEVKPSMSHTGP